MTTTLTPKEVKLFAFLIEKGGQFEMKEWAAIKPDVAAKLRELEKRGFVRFDDAILLPFKVKTGTQFCILTDAGRMAYESQLVEVKVPPEKPQYTCNHAFLRPDKSCVHCGAPLPKPAEPYRTDPGWENFDPRTEPMMGD